MIQLNLLPDIKKEYINAKKTKAMVIGLSIVTTVGAIGLTALFFVYVTFVQQLQINISSDSIKKKSSTLNNIPDLSKFLTIQNQLSALPSLHDQEGSYDRLFSFLQVLNPGKPNNISLSTLVLSSTDKTITFTGSTATFESLNIFTDTLRNAQVSYKLRGSTTTTTNKMFDSVSVQSSALANVAGASVVSFTIITTYSDQVFDATNTDVNAVVPSIETTQSVTQSPKQNPFSAPKTGGQ